MALYNSTIQKLKKDDYAKELYRFQGSNSYNCIKSNTIDNNGYLYFSNSLDHHKYFTLKRIKQLLAKELQELDLSLSLQYLHDPKTYHQIKRLIINSERIRDLYSYRLIYDTNYLSLIKDNYFYQEKKPSSSNIERVDRRVFGGGYGVKDEWKDLLSYLTLFISKQEITREDVLTLLSNMKKTNKNAIISLVCSIVSIVIFWWLSYAGIGSGILALKEIKKNNEKGKVLAIAGIVIGVISNILYFYFMFTKK